MVVWVVSLALFLVALLKSGEPFATWSLDLRFPAGVDRVAGSGSLAADLS
jgi:hypothetical protein